MSTEQGEIRFNADSTYTVEETIQKMRQIKERNLDDLGFCQRLDKNLSWLEGLDQNTVLIRWERRENETVPVATGKIELWL